MNDVSPMRLLAAGVPLTLLLDLAWPSGPDSREIIDHERREAQARQALYGRAGRACVAVATAGAATFTPSAEATPGVRRLSTSA